MIDRTGFCPEILAAHDTMVENMKGRTGIAIGIVATMAILWLSGELPFPKGISWPITYFAIAAALTAWDYRKLMRLFP